jgi:LmbE family N-acetylglucosaminyl deacetylase
MTAVLFAPHNDDEVLWSGMLAQHHRAHIIVVLRSQVQQDRGLGITAQRRECETAAAVQELGLTFEQWPYRDSDPDWDAVTAAMRALDDRLAPEVVLAPAVELGGHEQHSKVGWLAEEVFGSRVVFFATYVRGQGRTVTQQPFVGTAEQIARKLRALACFRSQIAEPSTQPWFLDGVGEWLA